MTTSGTINGDRPVSVGSPQDPDDGDFLRLMARTLTEGDRLHGLEGKVARRLGSL